MADNNLQLFVPILGTTITVIGTIIVTVISRVNSPVRKVLKKTNLQGNGTLAEALGVLQRQLKDEQVRYDKQIKDNQERHQEEIQYYVEQLRIARKEIFVLRDEKDSEIRAISERLKLCEGQLRNTPVIKN